MIVRKLSAGDIVEARCTRCAAVMNHRIVAMVGEKVVKVECNTCKGIHNYRAPEGSAKAAAAPRAAGPKKEAAPRKTKQEPGAADRAEWLALRPDMVRADALAYDMAGRYRVNDLVEHQVFGLGIVKALFKPGKMEVLFESGKKLLKCQ
jgi:hypothetical protein